MNIISRVTLERFWVTHENAKQPLLAWYDEVKTASWNTPQDIKDRYPTASILNKNRVVFNIKGNEYRLCVYVRYSAQKVYIRFIVTHAEYDKVNCEEI